MNAEAIQPIIFAGGRQTRWGNASSKHMVVVPREDMPGEEPLLLRTLRQLGTEARGNGLPLRPAVIAARVDQEFHGMESFSPLLYPEFCGRRLGAAMDNACVYFKDAYGFQLILMMGDVFWTPEALHEICRPVAVPTVYSDGWDTFAISVNSEDALKLLPAFRLRDHRPSFLAALGEVDIGVWRHSPITDRTQDFDIYHEYVQFRGGLSKNKHFQKTPQQRALRKQLGIRLKP